MQRLREVGRPANGNAAFARLLLRKYFRVSTGQDVRYPLSGFTPALLEAWLAKKETLESTDYETGCDSASLGKAGQRLECGCPYNRRYNAQSAAGSQF